MKQKLLSFNELLHELCSDKTTETVNISIIPLARLGSVFFTYFTLLSIAIVQSSINLDARFIICMVVVAGLTYLFYRYTSEKWKNRITRISVPLFAVECVCLLLLIAIVSVMNFFAIQTDSDYLNRLLQAFFN